jgi:HEAT repeat protein
LIEALSNRKPGLRAAASACLGNLGDERAATPLIAALRDTEAIVRCAAAEALGRLGAPAALQELIGDPNTLASAARALARMGLARGVPELMRITRDYQGKEVWRQSSPDWAIETLADILRNAASNIGQEELVELAGFSDISYFHRGHDLISVAGGPLRGVNPKSGVVAPCSQRRQLAQAELNRRRVSH